MPCFKPICILPLINPSSSLSQNLPLMPNHDNLLYIWSSHVESWSPYIITRLSWSWGQSGTVVSTLCLDHFSMAGGFLEGQDVTMLVTQHKDRFLSRRRPTVSEVL